MISPYHISILSITALLTVAAPITIAHSETLPMREAPRPVTTDGVPHVQIGVDVVPDLAEELLQRVAELPGVDVRDTVVSLPGALGFWLDDAMELERPEVIVGGREFAHLHPDGSLHASLSPELAMEAVEAGWAVMHPWAALRPGWDGFVMIYTPLTDSELDVVFDLVTASYTYVTGRTVEDL